MLKSSMPPILINIYPLSITRFRFHPVFLGGINNLSGNKPPWALPTKAAYQVFDGDRAKKYFNAMYIRTPDFFPTLSILVSNCASNAESDSHISISLNERCGTLKITIQTINSKPLFSLSSPHFGFHPRATYPKSRTLGYVKHRMRTVSPLTTTQANLLQNFTPEETEKILAGANSPEYKAKLTAATKNVVEERGAFGCPWYWVTNAEGMAEPFFGSDR